jgi:hypothetical protein
MVLAVCIVETVVVLIFAPAAFLLACGVLAVYLQNPWH